jgi:predicted GNAT family acetyltransferase
VRREERGSPGGRWTTVLDGHAAGMTYSRASASLVIIDHTEVSGARREGFRIIPLRPFAKAQFDRHAE